MNRRQEPTMPRPDPLPSRAQAPSAMRLDHYGRKTLESQAAAGQPASMRRRRLVGGALSSAALSLTSLSLTSLSLAALSSLAIPARHAQAAATAADPARRDAPMYAYVGSRTTRERNARGEGITVFHVDPQSGALTTVQVVRDLTNPSYLTLNRSGDVLYTVDGDLTTVSAFRVDRSTGQLSFLNQQDTEGRNPVHLAIDPSGQYLIVTNHLGSSLAVLPLGPDGALGTVSQRVDLSGPIGPHRIEQKQAKPHFNPFDPTGRFIIVPDKGLDRVFSYRFEGGRLTPADTPFVATREGAGPRHLAFHPSQPLVYVVNELDSTVTSYRLDRQTGALEPLQLLSTLPETWTGNSRAAGIMVDATGQTVYASNRGHDSIAIFRVRPDGLLTFTGADTTGGRTPRFFTLAPDGRMLYALNEVSDTIVSMRVDAQTGRLSLLAGSVATGSPVCMIFSA